jgi:hypothetical protein
VPSTPGDSFSEEFVRGIEFRSTMLRDMTALAQQDDVVQAIRVSGSFVVA